MCVHDAEPEEVHVPGHVRLFDASSTQVIASTTDNKTCVDAQMQPNHKLGVPAE